MHSLLKTTRRRAICLSLAFAALPCAAKGSLSQEDIIGSWYGLRTMPGSNISYVRRVEFFRDGRYVAKDPNLSGRYWIDGNSVVLPRLWVLRFENGILRDGTGMLIRGKPTRH